MIGQNRRHDATDFKKTQTPGRINAFLIWNLKMSTMGEARNFKLNKI